MNQLEYGDYYKFIASVGIALIAAAVLLPWLFLHESFDLTIEAAKITLLTPEAQAVIYKRQHFVALAVCSVPWASVFLALAGVVTTAIGLHNWHARQAVKDKDEDLANEKLEKELRPMSPEAIVEKARIDEASIEDLPSTLLKAQLASAENPYLASETAVLNRLRECYGNSVKTNQRLGSAEYDAIIRSKESERIIVEIKYIAKGFRQGWLLETLNGLSARTQLYATNFSQEARGVLLIVLGSDARSSAERVDAMYKQSLETQSSRFSNLRTRLVELEKVSELSCEKLRELLG